MRVVTVLLISLLATVGREEKEGLTMIIVIKEALDGRSLPEAGDYVYNLMLSFAYTDDEFVLDLQGVYDIQSLSSLRYYRKAMIVFA